MIGGVAVAWIGQGQVSRKIGGRDGGNVRLGDYVVPRVALFTFDGERGEPDVRMRFEVRDGRPECVEVTLLAKGEGRAVRTSDLQAIAVDAQTVSTFATLSHRVLHDAETNTTRSVPINSERDFWQAVNVTEEEVKRPGRGRTWAELEQVARVYRENIDGHPVAAVRVTMGYGSERTAHRRVEQAREVGLLPPTTPGKKRA